MNRRSANSSRGVKGLLGRQLINITDTLTNSSQRRDAELEKRKTRKLTAAPVVHGLRHDSSAILKAANSDRSGSDNAHQELSQLRIGLKDAAFGITQSDMKTATITGAICRTRSIEAEEIYRSRRMFAELDERASLPPPVIFSEKSETMSEVFNQQTQLPSREPSEDKEAYLEALWGRLTTDFSPLRDSCDNVTSETSRRKVIGPGRFSDFTVQSKVDKTSGDGIDHSGNLYAVALHLETTGSEWEHVRGWTTHLFGTSCDSNAARQSMNGIVKRAVEESEKIVQGTMAEEIHNRVEDQANLRRRLIVSNIAAGADDNDILGLFSKFELENPDIRILDERDPINGTQIAYVNMQERKSAIEASFINGQVFGLKVNIELAVKRTEQT
ncbi:hypothetical protein BKA66DRAFT_568348 [Pyrenochaeta sp. MPI-SDFR-AT-0127]|nr:hypothetical protein BKA66DRAFT_568348 [Pyrenochaeta sp. MPI-SDFR-AT-0127]